MYPGGGRVELFDDIGFLLSRGSGLAVRTTNTRLARLGLRVRHYSVLSAVCDSDGVSQRELSEVVGLDPSQIVALVDDLQSAGLVERLPDPRDRRTRLVSATRRGRTVRRQARAEAERARDEFLAGLDGAERSVLLGLLQRVVLTETPGGSGEVAS
jgi:DNA-binding MarR family transcriptional regulator